MKPSLPTTVRRVLSLAAFSALIAAVTMSFADRPNTRTSVSFKGQPAVRVTPSPAIRLAEAPRKAKTKSTVSASAAVPKSSGGLTGSLNLNLATAQELMLLPGIGPKKAAIIIKWREKRGNFKRVVDLRRVKGFGAKTVKKLRPYLTVTGKTTLE